MMGTSVGNIAVDLLRYGEPDAADWVLRCSDDELVRVCSVADWLLLKGPAKPSGSSMMIAKACAMAAIYVKEGAPRELARARRLPSSATPTLSAPAEVQGRWPRNDLQMGAPRHYGVGDDAQAAWQASPTG